MADDAVELLSEREFHEALGHIVQVSGASAVTALNAVLDLRPARRELACAGMPPPG